MHFGEEQGCALALADQQLLSGVPPGMPLVVMARRGATVAVSLEEKLAGITTLYTPFAPPEGRVECRDVLQLYAKTVAKDPWDGINDLDQSITAAAWRALGGKPR